MCRFKPKISAWETVVCWCGVSSCCSPCVFSFRTNPEQNAERRNISKETIIRRGGTANVLMIYSYFSIMTARQMCSLKCVFSCHILFLTHLFISSGQRDCHCHDLYKHRQFVVLLSVLSGHLTVFLHPSFLSSLFFFTVYSRSSFRLSFLLLRYCYFVAQEIKWWFILKFLLSVFLLKFRRNKNLR